MAWPHPYPLIFNPKARSQKGERVLRFLMAHANRFAMYATNHAGEARDLAARFAKEGEPVVIAAGGDGTLNEVVNGLLGSPHPASMKSVPVGPIPTIAVVPGGSEIGRASCRERVSSPV